MNRINTAKLPIGFGLGRTKDHWDQVLAEYVNDTGMIGGSTHAVESVPAPANKDILSIEEVAAIFKCGISSVRRISPEDLPRCEGPGRNLLFLHEDLVKFLRARTQTERRNSGLSQPKTTRRRKSCVESKVNFLEDTRKALRLKQNG
jgi:hypothetical protein